MRPSTRTPAATLFGLWSFSAAAAPLSPEETAGHIGEGATVCGVVASAEYEANEQNQPTHDPAAQSIRRVSGSSLCAARLLTPLAVRQEDRSAADIKH